MTTELFNKYSIILSAIGFTLTFVGIFFVYLQIVAARKGNETQTLIALYQISSSEPLMSDLNRIWEFTAEGPTTNEDRDSCLRACIFFEMLGAICEQKYIKTLLIEEFFGSLITGVYQASSPFINKTRSTPYNNKFASNFEKLSKKIKRSHRVSARQGQA